MTKFLAIVCLSGWIALCSAVAFAEQTVQKVDVRLLIDTSGSMRQSDPDNMRAAALTLIVRLLPPGAKAGVWLFGDRVTPLVPHRKVDAQWREQALAAVSRIDNSGQRTDIPAALDVALADMTRLTSEYRTSVVLLTDGRVDVSPSPMANARAARQLLQERAPALGEMGIPIHTIALSQDADWDVLESLAHATGATADKAQTAEQLSAIYLQVLERIAPAERVPLVDNSFVIDERVSEFTALAFLESGAAATGLTGPDGRDYRADQNSEDINWYSSDQFTIVTVQNPQPGKWTMAAASDARLQVSVISDLRLQVEPLPGSIAAGKPLELAVFLTEREKTISDPALLALFEVSLIVTTPDGALLTIPISRRDDAPQSGEFRVPLTLFSQAGRYNMVVRVQGDTFHRELPLALDVYQPKPIAREISTRESKAVMSSLRKPAVYGVAGAVLLLLLSLLWSRHRRKRRLAQWHNRVRSGSQSQSTEGFSAKNDD